MGTISKTVLTVTLTLLVIAVSYMGYSMYQLQATIDEKFETQEEEKQKIAAPQDKKEEEPKFKTSGYIKETAHIEEGNLKANIGVTVQYSGTDCIDMECFEEYFASCTPTEFTAGNPTLGTFYYKILEARDGRCAILNKYLSHPKPEFLDKEMTCFYDNTKRLSEAYKEISGSSKYCTGELMEFLADLYN